MPRFLTASSLMQPVAALRYPDDKQRIVIFNSPPSFPFNLDPRRIPNIQIKTAAISKKIGKSQFPLVEMMLRRQVTDKRKSFDTFGFIVAEGINIYETKFIGVIHFRLYRGACREEASALSPEAGFAS